MIVIHIFNYSVNLCLDLNTYDINDNTYIYINIHMPIGHHFVTSNNYNNKTNCFKIKINI